MKKNVLLYVIALLTFTTVLSAQTSKVQVIHNSADAAAKMVDVYLDGTMIKDNFRFRSATPFLDVPAGVEIEVAIAPSSSTSVGDAIATFNYNLDADETYIIVANGIVSPSGYSPATAFDLHVYAMGREQASMNGNTDVLVFHGATDAPTVDVAETAVPAGTIVNDLAYADFAGYLELGTSDYVLEVQDETGAVTVASFDAPLSTLGLENQALVVLASGFLSPANNSYGEAFGLYVALPSGGDLVALPQSMARAQFIHNSADKAAEIVNVFVDGKMLIHDLEFRTSTLFLDVPAGIETEIAIVPYGKLSTDDAVATFMKKFKSGTENIAIINGIASPSGYNPATPLNIYIQEGARISSNQPGNTDVLVFHGSTDAPTVDVYESSIPAGTIVNNISYGHLQGYLELATMNYTLDVKDESGQSTVASFQAPLKDLGLDGQGLVLLASGFLNPSNNSNGPEFGLFAALSSGGQLVPLPLVIPETARAQVIHNSADAAAEMVDVYLDGTLLVDDFMFRTATPFVDLPAGVEIEVAIAPSSSTSVGDAIATFNYNLATDETYIIVANGIVSPSGYSPATAFDLHVYAMGREKASMNGNTDVLVFHGATDAPTVDVAETAVPAGTIVNDLAYADFAGYLELGTSDYVLEVQDQTGAVTVASYDAPLSTLGLENQALVVLASGFLSPANNSNGEVFGLYVALPSGGDLVALPQSMARAQVIHNSADAAAEMVDVYLDGTLLVDDFMFRTATPFVDLPAGVEIEVAIAPSSSTSVGDAIATFNYNLAANETYIIVANGIVSSTGYSPAAPFNLYVYPMGREQASQNGFTDVLVFHGATDAPTVDVEETSLPAGTIVDNLEYADFAGYLELPTNDYKLEIKDETGETKVAAYSAPLQTLGLENQALVVVASGFLNTINNSNGKGFGLYVALSTGGELVELPNITSVSEIQINNLQYKTYPNPATDFIYVELDNMSMDSAEVSIYSTNGQLIDRQRFEVFGQKINYSTSSLKSGQYIMVVVAEGKSNSGLIEVVR